MKLTRLIEMTCKMLSKENGIIHIYHFFTETHILTPVKYNPIHENVLLVVSCTFN